MARAIRTLISMIVVVSALPLYAGVAQLHTAQVAFTDGTQPATVYWNPPFPDTNYTAVCTAETQPSDYLLPVITSRAADSMTVIPTDSSTAPGTLNCIGIADSDGSDMRHARAQFSAAPATITVSWNSAFSDTNYTAVCTLEDSATTGFTSVISAVATDSVTVVNGGSQAGTVHCIGVPDSDTSNVRRSRTAVLATTAQPSLAWNGPFANTSYVAVCSDELDGASSANSAIAILGGSRQAGSLTAIPELAADGVVHCLGAPVSIQFGAVGVNTAPSGYSVYFGFNSTVTVGSVAVLTQGAAGKDFQSSGGTCASGTYNAGDSCTVDVTFSPLAPGNRLGAAVLYDTSTPAKALATVYLTGVGTAGAMSFSPGIITTYAGGSSGTYGGDGGPATSAGIADPEGIAIDGAGNVYIADAADQVVRKVDAVTGIITRIAGTGTAGYNGDNIAATSAQLANPFAVAVDGAGNLYIADESNQRIRKVNASTGIITTVAGNGNFGYNGDNIPATSAQFSNPAGVAVDGAGNIYVGDSNNNRVRRIDAATGLISTVAGNGTAAYAGDGAAATLASLNSPVGVALDAAGNLYIADSNNNAIRRVDASTGNISTIAGTGQPGFSGDGSAATAAQLAQPGNVAVDAAGNVYIADSSNGRIRLVTSDGAIHTIAGNGNGPYAFDNVTATSERLNPSAVALDGAGNLYISDNYNFRVRKVDVADGPSYTLPNTVAGSTSPAQDVVLLNIGNAPLTLGAISLIGPTVFNFQSPDTTCALTGGQVINAGSACILGITFSPTSAGSIQDMVEFTDDSLNSGSTLHNFSVSGTGIGVPNVLTGSISNTTQTSATAGGTVSSDGGSPVTVRGTCWSLSPNPTTSDSCTADGSGTGTFSSSLSSLVQSTTYHYRAYATNAAGTGYGSDSTFTTASTASVDLGLNSALSSYAPPVGGSAVISYTVHNYSGIASTGASVTFTLPASGLLTSLGTSYAGPVTASCSGSGAGPITCTLPSLAAGAQESLSLTVTSVVAGAYSVNASLTGADPDGFMSNNMTSNTVVFQAPNAQESLVLADTNTGNLLSYPVNSSSYSTLGMAGGAFPNAIVLSPNGRLGYVGYVDSYISVYDFTLNAEVRRIPLPRTALGTSGARGLVLSADGTKLLVLSRNDAAFLIDTTTYAVQTVNLDGLVGDSSGKADIFSDSAVIAGSKAYLNSATASIPNIVIDFSTTTPTVGTVSGSTGYGAPPSHRNHTMALANSSTVLAGRGSTVLLISTATNAVTSTVAMPNGNVQAIAADAYRNYAYVANGAYITVLDLHTGPSFGTILTTSAAALPFTPADLAVSADGNTLVATNSSGAAASLNTNAILGNSSSFVNISISIPNAIVRATALGTLQTSPPAAAPSVDRVDPAEITNEAPKTVRILGSGFSSGGGNFQQGAVVRIGSMDPLPTTFVSSNELDVTIPAGAAAGYARIVVTNPNSADVPLGRNVSGGDAYLQIDPPATFVPTYAVISANFYSLTSLWKTGAEIPAGGPGADQLALSPDGQNAYFVLDYSGANLVSGVNLDTGAAVGPVGLPAGPDPGSAMTTDPVTGKKVALYTMVATTGTGTTGNDDQLAIVDIDPASATRNTVLATIAPNLNDSVQGQGLTVTPDGRYAYATVLACPDSTCAGTITHLLVYDLQARTVTNAVPDVSTIGAASAQPATPHITPDGSSLLLSDPNSNIVVYDISGGAPNISSTPIATIGSSAGSGAKFIQYMVLGTRLYAGACDSTQCYLEVFNFVRGAPSNFSALGSVAVSPSLLGIAVTPDSKYVYASLGEQDAVGVYDANGIATSSATAFITNIATGIGPTNDIIGVNTNPLRVSARTNATADLSLCASDQYQNNCTANASVAAIANQQTFVFFHLENVGPSTATGVTFTATLPAGVTLNAANAYPNHVSGIDLPIACTGTTTATCNLPDLRVFDSSANQQANIDIALAITPTATAGITISGAVSANELDPNSSNNAATASLTGGADLQVSGTASADPVTIGSQLTYTITVKNNGPQDAGNVTGNFYSQLQITSATPSQGSCSGGTCSFGAIAAGGVVTVTATGTVTSQSLISSTDGTVNAYLYANDASVPDPNQLNNYTSVTTHLVAGGAASEYLFSGDSTQGDLVITDPATNTPPYVGNAYNGIAAGSQPDDIVTSPNRHLAFVAHQAAYISVVDTTIQRVIQRIHLRGGVHRLALTPDGTALLVAPLGQDDLEIIDLTHFPFQVTKHISLNGAGGNPALPAGQLGVADLLPLGSGCGIANLNACTVYLTTENGPSNDGNPALNIVVVNLGSSAVSTIANSNAGIGYFSGKNIAALPDGSAILVVQMTADAACSSFDRVLRIATATNTITGSVNLPDSCNVHGFALGNTPNGVYGYVTTWLDAPNFTQRGVLQLSVTASTPSLGNSLVISAHNDNRLVMNAAGTKLYLANISVNSTTTPSNVFVVDTALLNSNTPQTPVQFRAGNYIQAFAMGSVDLVPEPGASGIVIDDVQPRLIINDTPTTVTITGSGFAPDSTVKIGSLDPMPANFISSSELRVTVPAQVPSQSDVAVIVTNPNTTAPAQSQFISAAADFTHQQNGLQIITPLSFQPKYEVAALTDGDSNLSIFQAGRSNSSAPFLQGSAFWPSGLAYSGDGSTIYVPAWGMNYVPSGTAVMMAITPSSNNYSPYGATPVGGTGILGWGANTVAVAPNPSQGNQPVAYFANNRGFSSGGFDALYFIGANPQLSSSNTVVDTVLDATTPDANRNSTTTNGLVASPSGRYVYSMVSSAAQELVIYDTVARTATAVPLSSLSAGIQYYTAMAITPDGNQLLLGVLNAANQTIGIGIFDIHTNPLAPALVQIVSPVTPAGLQPVSFGDYKVMSNHLYAYDPTQNVVEAFSYGSGGAAVTFLNYYAFDPNMVAQWGNGTLAVTPDDAMIYVSHFSDDSVSVLDAGRLTTSATQNDPAVLITRMASGFGPTVMAVNPVPLSVTPVDQSITLTHAPASPVAGTPITYTITVANNSGIDSSGGGFELDLDPSLNLTYATFYDPTWMYAQNVSCTGKTHILCSFGGSGSGSNGGGLPANFSTQLTVVADTTTTGAITSRALIGGDNYDPNSANNVSTDSAVVAVNPSNEADLKVEAAVAPTLVNGLPAYSATVTNLGPAMATNVTFSDILERYGFNSASATQGGPCTFANSIVTCPIGDLDVNGTATITIAVQEPSTGWAANTFHASASQPDPNLANNSMRTGSAAPLNTPPGSAVTVAGADPTQGVGGDIVFDSVTSAGNTAIAPMQAPAPPPPGYRNGATPVALDIATTAKFSGGINISLQFPAANFRHPAKVRLFHLEGGAWVDRTLAVNPATGTVMARVLSLSPFTLLEPLDIAPVANAGASYDVNGTSAAANTIVLDGSASLDGDGDTLSYRWSGPFPEGGGAVTGVKPSVTLPVGVSRVSLVVNDGEIDSTAATVDVTVSDFSVTAASNAASLRAGQSASYSINVGSVYGAFAAPVKLACSSPSATVTCSLSDVSLTPGAHGATATLTITAHGTTASLSRHANGLLALWFGPFFGIVLAGGKNRRARLLLVLLALALMLGYIGCGGGSTTTSTPNPTPSATVPVTVSGTSSSLAHSTTVTVTVQ